MLQTRFVHRIKAVLLTTMVVAGGTMFTSCGILDLRNTVIAGTQTFLQNYVAGFLTTLIPPII